MGRIFFWSLLVAAVGVAMTVAGFRSEPDDALASLKYIGPAIAGGGVLMMALYVFFFRS